MSTILRKKLRKIICLIAAFLFLNTPAMYAAGPPKPSALDNPVTIGFLILMLILLLIIFMLAQLLTGVADVKIKKEKQEAGAVKVTVSIGALIFFSGNTLLAQTTDTASTGAAANIIIAGMPATTFYMLASVIFLELLVISVLLLNVKTLLNVEPEEIVKANTATVWKTKLRGWWIKLNSFKSAEQEANIDLGHDYDGIRELDNRLPPWWLYGFYLTIIVSCIYLYRFHVSHTGPSGVQEYETEVAKADTQVKEYLKSKGEAVDENTVTLLTGEGDLAEGKTFFAKSCVACHNEGGSGNVGPNLTDEYWLHGGDIKSVFKTIRYGINAMPQWQNSYSNKQIAELASYVKSLKGSKPANPKGPQGVLETEAGSAGKSTADSTVKTASVTANK